MMTAPIKVMHLRACNFVGGPEKQILEHFARLDPARFTPLLGTFGAGVADPLGAAAAARNFNAVSLPVQAPFNPGSVHRLYRVLKEHRVALLCTHGYKPNILGCLAAAAARIPSLAVSRGWTFESPKIRFYEWLDRRFLRLADHVVAVSAGQKQKIVDCGVNAGKVTVIHNAINLQDVVQTDGNRLRSVFGLPADAIVVASAGRLSPEKNYATMVDVARSMCVGHERLYFIVFGEGALRSELERQIALAGLQDRFLLPGFRTDLPALLPEIDIFMLPSLTEGLPNVILEAFANRKPVVATAVGGTPEVIQDGVSGYLMSPDDVSGIIEALTKLLADPDLRQRMGNAGNEYVSANFDFSAQTAAYERIYREMLCRRET